jgi:hypothetical protein
MKYSGFHRFTVVHVGFTELSAFDSLGALVSALLSELFSFFFSLFFPLAPSFFP